MRTKILLPLVLALIICIAQLVRTFFLVFSFVPYSSDQSSQIWSSVDINAGVGNNGTYPSSAARLCDKDPSLCAKGTKIKHHIRSRLKFSTPLKTSCARILIRDDVFAFFGRQRWLTAASFDECPHRCSVTENAAEFDVSVSLFNLPRYLSIFTSRLLPDKAYAVLNLEPHSFESLPTEISNVLLMSFHAESEVVVNYGYSVMHTFGLCIGDESGTRDNGDKCENMRARDSPFYRWCSGAYGDFFTCVFQIVPHIAHMPWARKSNDTLAVAWISATCWRHTNFLQRLMQLINIDSMGKCLRNRDESGHPGIQVMDHDSIWWGKDKPVPIAGTGARKMLIATHYKFFVSIENTIMDDYVTEKFYEGFLTDSLMVYLGAPNARRYAPAPHSFINAHDFDSPESLAAHMLELAADPARFSTYFAWREARPVRVSAEFVRSLEHNLVRLDNLSMLCRLCGRVQPASHALPS
jgi:hypothetical protein